MSRAALLLSLFLSVCDEEGHTYIYIHIYTGKRFEYTLVCAFQTTTTTIKYQMIGGHGMHHRRERERERVIHARARAAHNEPPPSLSVYLERI